MTLAWQVVRIAAVVGVLTLAFSLLPEADPDAVDTFTIPTAFFVPIAAILKLNLVFPFSALLVCAGLTMGKQIGMVAVWAYSFIAKHVFG